MTTQTRTRADFLTPHGHGVSFVVRDGTSDWNTCNAITAVGDEYHQPAGLSGWALDVGAHIGACAITLLADNPDLRVVAIEALPENVELLRENLALNGFTDRCIVIEGAAGNGSDPVRIGYGSDGTHDYIGSASAPDGNREALCPVVRLGDVIHSLPLRNDEPIVWAKLDCEGCEYTFLDPAFTWNFNHIEGEVHHGWQRLVDILEPTHLVHGEGKDFGAFTAVRR